METKFYVGQKVKDERYGLGIVKYITHHGTVYVEFDNFSICSYRPNGAELGTHIDLFPADPEPFRLTEWQCKLLDTYFWHEKGVNLYVEDYAKIESILSEPEPPKYQPKQGDGVLVRDHKDAIWVARIATGEGFGTYNSGAISQWEYCRPFDASLVGKITND